MALGNAFAWHVQAARNVPHAIMLGTTAALPKKNGKRTTKKGYVLEEEDAEMAVESSEKGLAMSSSSSCWPSYGMGV